MGLDMYAFIVDADKVGDKVTDVALPLKVADTTTEICYWRKFNALHGWMEDLKEKCLAYIQYLLL